MNFKHLRTFVTIAEHGSVSRAAGHLHITQPALSRQIQSLQQELGLRLLEQVGRRLVLTSVGEEFLNHCHSLIGQADAVLASAQSLSRGNSGVLRIGAAPQTIARFFPSFLERYKRAHPDVRVKLIEAPGVRQLEMLKQGALHFAVTIMFGKEDRIASEPLPPLPILVLSRKQDTLGACGVVEVQSLEGIPLLLVGPDNAVRVIFEAVCRLARIKPNIQFEGNAPHTLAALAEAGYGVAIVPGTLSLKSNRLRVSRLELNARPVSLPLSIHWNEDRPLPRYAQDFPGMFASHAREVLMEEGIIAGRHNGTKRVEKQRGRSGDNSRRKARKRKAASVSSAA
jgi:DNA-binding transcriptional LysR family regulator